MDAKFIKNLKLFSGNQINLKETFRVLSNNYENIIKFDAPTRHKGSSSFNFNNLTDLALSSITYSSNNPLKIVLFLGIIIFVLTSILLIYMITTDFVLRIYDFRAISYFIVYNTNLSGLIIFLVGIIGIYIGNIHNETSKRPKYIIETKNF